MLDNEPTTEPNDTSTTEPAPRPRRRRAASRPAGPPQVSAADEPTGTREPSGTPEAAEPAPATAPRKRATRKRAAAEPSAEPAPTDSAATTEPAAEPAAEEPPAPRKRATRKRAASATQDPAATESAATESPAAVPPVTFAPPVVLFQPPDPAVVAAAEAAEEDDRSARAGSDDEERTGRRRRRGGRGRKRTAAEGEDAATSDITDPTAGTAAPATEAAEPEAAEEGEEGEGTGTTRRRRRRRRRKDETDDEAGADTGEVAATVVKVREPRSRRKAEPVDDDEVRTVRGSTRLEAKKQRRREGREAGRRRPSIITEAEFLARREAVDRTMIVRQLGERTQIAVLEDDILVEHYVSTASSAGLVGNVYLGKVQNVLPSMEAAFVDIGRGRNAVLYAGEVNWDAAGLEGQPRRIELALKPGDPVLVQVTKDPIGHKGARLTSQVSLAGRYLVLVPNGSMTGISRKLPDTERSRLKSILKKVVPDAHGVIVRTAAEGASEEELARDVARLTAQWEVIEAKAQKGSSAPTLLYSEPDMTIRVVRDIFNEDFNRLIVSGDEAWDLLEPYVAHVAPDLRDRLSKWTDTEDVFTAHRIDEQLTKALDRKVWLPSGGYLIIDRTEAMVVIDVNTGKFTGAGGNLEETVTRNNLEAAEEIVRQLRLRDLGGIIVIDFIDMVLESNRDLVLRRLLECLGRDRTKHQVAEVTSLGLVQMTRKRVGQGLHEAFSTPCEHCNGRGYHMSTEPVESRRGGSARGEKSDKPAKADKSDRADKADQQPRRGRKRAKAEDRAEDRAEDKAEVVIEAEAATSV